MARYAFAARFAHGKRVLDIGCGSGYGAAQLSQVAASVTALDVAAEALSYAREHYPAGNLRFIMASCAALPVAGASTDLVVAFELIEHVRDWKQFLADARRVLAAHGQFIVSTPNKFYYGESRGPSGPNPYHVHEFEFDEFRGELAQFFPYSTFFLQNHADGIVFQALEPDSPGEVRVEHDGAGSAESNFFIAVCSVASKPPASTFVYVPKSANILRERELHIRRLEGEVATKDEWLREAKEEHQQLLEVFRAQTAELEERNRWAEDLDKQLTEAKERIVGLQDELAKVVAGYEAKIKELEEEITQRTRWAIETEARLNTELADRQKQLEDKCQELATCVDLLHAAEATVEERTAWALGLQTEAEQLKARLNFVRASRWVRLGRVVGLGPEIGDR